MHYHAFECDNKGKRNTEKANKMKKKHDSYYNTEQRRL